MPQYNEDKHTKLLNMNQVARYHRVSTESDEESGSITIDVKVHKLNVAKRINNVEQRHSPWTCECICRLFVLFILLVIAMGFAIHHLPPIKNQNSGTPEVSKPQEEEEEEHHHVYVKAAVAAGTRECSSVGVSVLREGGKAVDAAIATLLCQGVVEPEYSGIGGGFFMTIYNHTSKQSTVIDARETAPAGSNASMFSSATSIHGPSSIAVPGELKGYSVAYQRYGGGVKWERLFTSAIDKAQNGFKVGKQLELKLKEHKAAILNNQLLCDLYCDQSRSSMKKAGDTAYNGKLAETLKVISENGVNEFYNGAMARAMAREIQEHGGRVTRRDFAKYQAKERNTLKIPLYGSNMILVVPPAPSGGPILAMIMSLMDSYNITSDMFNANESLYWHRTVEAFKHAFGARTHFADPDFVPMIKKLVDNLLSRENIQRVREKIVDDKTFTDQMYYYGAQFTVTDGPPTSTSHVSVLAPNGDVVSVTSTINEHFGSYFVSPSTGVLFNNEMADFFTKVNSLTPNQDVPNVIEPGKRPQSSMSPCIVLDGNTHDAVYIIGAAGGKQIPTSIAISLLRLLYFGSEDFDEPIREPRIHNQLMPDILKYEKEFDRKVLDNLQAIGHKIEEQVPMSHVNGIKNHISHVHAFSDVRNLGAEADGW